MTQAALVLPCAAHSGSSEDGLFCFLGDGKDLAPFPSPLPGILWADKSGLRHMHFLYQIIMSMQAEVEPH